ncbi:hypothetical protein [Anaerostipes faecalis]|uniref:hypothetical protein n=1 Tax=Anaerostipes faecalis TaxID=2738446 RepID=UPI001C1DF886|nr:hypothetical protein [Anaerostipes faecalis]
MFVLKLIGKVCVLPAIVVFAFLLGIVKVCVGIYNFARALFGLLIGALVILTVIFYQDWLQIGLLVIISCIGISILAAGIFLEIILESGISRLSKFVLS